MDTIIANPIELQRLKDEKIAVLLSMMAPDVVQDIATYMNKNGGSAGTISMLFDSNGRSQTLQPLAIFSSKYITPAMAPRFLMGWSLLALGAMKQERRTLIAVQNGSFDKWEHAFASTFALPGDLAKAIALKVDTTDALNPSGDPKNDSVGAKMKEKLRKIVNVLGSPFGLEMDQNQQFDSDFIYECALAGEQVVLMNQRASAISGQARWLKDGSGSMIGGGDPASDVAFGDSSYELGDLENLYSHVTQGDITSFLGPWGAIIGKGVSALAKLISNRNANPDSQTSKLMTGSPVVTNGAVNVPNVYGDIADEYGDAYADAWLHGDIDAMVKLADYQTGDVTGEDEAIYGGDLYESEYGEPYIGDLAGRMRIKRLRRKLRRTRRRTAGRKGKQAASDAQDAEIARLESQIARAESDNVQSDQTDHFAQDQNQGQQGNDGGSYSQSSADEGGFEQFPN